jgi:hypothetical protein
MLAESTKSRNNALCGKWLDCFRSVTKIRVKWRKLERQAFVSIRVRKYRFIVPDEKLEWRIFRANTVYRMLFQLPTTQDTHDIVHIQPKLPTTDYCFIGLCDIALWCNAIQVNKIIDHLIMQISTKYPE